MNLYFYVQIYMERFSREEIGILHRAIAHRRSMGLARLKEQDIPRELLEELVQAANWAPSHGDTEPWRFSIFTGDGRGILADAFEKAYHADRKGDVDQSALEGYRRRAFLAPAWITIGMTPALNEDGTLKMTLEEELMAVACSVQNLHLMACAHGLAGMWHSKGVSTHATVASELGLDSPSRLLGMFLLGYPAIEWTKGERGAIEDKVKWYVAGQTR